MKHKIMGYGEIGKAIGKCLPEFSIKEKDFNHGDRDCDVLHVCYFSDNFIEEVGDEIGRSGAECVIIHSTVKVGTTKALQDLFFDVEVVHSPVIGVHPDLYLGLKTFSKFLGYDKRCTIANDVLRHGLGIASMILVINDSSITEKLKLLSTTYYGLCIAFHQYAFDLIGDKYWEKNSLWTKEYNEGYTKLGKDNVVRPNLDPPMGKIGGHCVISNAKILKEQFPDKLLDVILRYE